MSDYATQVGMDVHARSVSCRAMGLATGETWSKTVSGEGMEAELAPLAGQAAAAPALRLRVRPHGIRARPVPAGGGLRLRRGGSLDAAALAGGPPAQERPPRRRRAAPRDVQPRQRHVAGLGAADRGGGRARPREARSAKQRCSMPLLKLCFVNGI